VRQWPWGSEEKVREEGILAPFCRAQRRRAVYFEEDVMIGKTENAIGKSKTFKISVEIQISVFKKPRIPFKL
jgi:hypothetical protein